MSGEGLVETDQISGGTNGQSDERALPFDPPATFDLLDLERVDNVAFLGEGQPAA